MTKSDFRITARTSRLQANTDSFDADDGPWTVSGIAVGEGDILHMDDGRGVLFDREVIAESAHTQNGQPLTVDHPTDENGRPEYPPNTEDVVGKITKAGHVKGKGLAYEATVHDPEVARGIHAGTLEVSVHPQFNLGDTDDETGALTAQNVEFLDLSVVSKGDSPNNTAEWGPSAQLVAWTNAGDTSELDADEPTEDVEPQTESVMASFAKALRSCGFSTGEVTADAGTPEETPDEPAESGADSTDTMGNEPDNTGDGDESGQDAQTIGEMTPKELGQVLSEQGFVKAGDVEAVVTEATAAKEKEDKVTEIIAASDEYSEDDKDDLMASSEKLIEQEHKRLTQTVTASLPGNAGGRKHASHQSGDDLDAYGTGVGN